MAVDDTYGFLTCHNRIIFLKAARKAVLASLHVQHTGQTKTLMNARQLYFWPGMTNDVKLMISTCKECTLYLPSQTLEPQINTTATRPFESVSIDLGKQNGKEHLIFADRYSGWTLVRPLKKLDTEAVTTILEDWFLEHGKPVSIRSDGGPQFREKFTQWCERQHIRHELSSAYHHESNGHAECAVREMKHLLGKTESFNDFRNALREWRNTPRYDGLSPAQWLYGRRQRTDAPAIPAAYDRIPDAKFAEHEARREEKMDKHRSYSDQSSRPLKPMKPGDKVIAQNTLTKRWDTHATIISRRRDGRSYWINSDGRNYVRNRKFLRPCLIPDPPDAAEPIPAEPTTTRRYSKRTGDHRKVQFDL